MEIELEIGGERDILRERGRERERGYQLTCSTCS